MLLLLLLVSVASERSRLSNVDDATVTLVKLALHIAVVKCFIVVGARVAVTCESDTSCRDSRRRFTPSRNFTFASDVEMMTESHMSREANVTPESLQERHCVLVSGETWIVAEANVQSSNSACCMLQLVKDIALNVACEARMP